MKCFLLPVSPLCFLCDSSFASEVRNVCACTQNGMHPGAVPHLYHHHHDNHHHHHDNHYHHHHHHHRHHDDHSSDCNDKCANDPLKVAPLLCGCDKIDDTDYRYEEVRVGLTKNLKAGDPYPRGAPGDISCGGNAYGSTCLFPFELAGKTYNTCTRDGYGRDWCRAGVGTTTGLRFGHCDCPGTRGCASVPRGVCVSLRTGRG